MSRFRKEPRIETGLKLGLISIVIVSALMLAHLAIRAPIQTGAGARETASATEFVPADPASIPLLKTLSRTHAGLAADLERDLGLYQTAGLDVAAERTQILLAGMRAMQVDAPYFRRSPTGHLDAILAGFSEGMAQLNRERSDWCAAESLAALTRENEQNLVPIVLGALASNEDAYAWATSWAVTVLSAAESARQQPYYHGPRTARDKRILQMAGRQIGTERWTVALSIASFSQAEGQNYHTMQDAIEAINVCTLADTMVELSGRLPVDVRGRIIAELAPEVFYGNAPYSLYLLQGYFFLE